MDVSIGTPSLTTIEQDAPTLSNSQTTPEAQSSTISHEVEEVFEDTENDHDLDAAHMMNDPYFGKPILANNSEASSSTDAEFIHVQSNHPLNAHNQKWTQDHPLENIIGDIERPVSTRHQLNEQALFCYYEAFLTAVEPKSWKDAMTQAC